MAAELLPLALALASQPATRDVANETPATSSAFRLDFSLEAWLPRLEGDFTDGGGEVDVRTPDLHDNQASFAGELALVRDRLSVAIRGFNFATDGGGTAATPFTLGGVAVASGDAYTSEFSWWSVGAEVSYDLWRPLAQEPAPWSTPREDFTPAANGTELAFFGLISADIDAISRTIADSTSGNSSDQSDSYLALEVGAGFRFGFDTKASFPVVRRIDITAKGAFGAAIPVADGDLGTASRVEADISFWFCKEGAAYFGYRLVGGEFDGDVMELDGSLQGLLAGIKLVF
ncbi:MAG: hypothetical protein QM516_00875 [Limnohabitans sp.]|jgi:hypothetical protein|nr:hypothetical protein [Limnohabitans sp.]